MTTDDTPDLLRTWYGHDPRNPDPDPDRAGIQLVGGPLDGEWLVVDDGDPPYPGGVALESDGCAWQYGRSHYEHADPPSDPPTT
ncbi:hypothetical protein ACFRCG_33450 [Embleya sp. NPDC056575]|uniref:hypothetical protein n=1 Tax=unclassified Embleya TaxID=2699296 RepID=UPI0036877184